MSNQIGDRYSCTNSACGCEVEIQRPGDFSGSQQETGSANRLSQQESGTSNPSRHDFRSEPVSTVGDFGDQGATGEGTFGGAGSGDRSATASGRYDTASTRLREGSTSIASTLVCFCGSPMREIGAGQKRAQAARASSGPGSSNI